ncbi:MAG: outer membrane lipoprotein-sorting protein [Salinisphaeraceae bacterium]|nr:outer membrane lipoprotein-sorting protein [Salinisphaeraceae bacterium]
MKQLALTLALLLMSATALAESLADRFEARYLGWTDFCAILDLTVTSRSGGQRLGEAEACVFRPSNDTGYLRAKVLAPIGAKGIEIISHVKQGEERKQWLYSPATKRATPVNDSRAESPFMGTDLSYVDLGINLMDPEDMKKTGSGDCDGKPCVAYDIEPREGEYRRQAWLIEATGALHRVDIYDGDKQIKRMSLGDETQSEEGFWLPSSVTVENLRTGSKTELRYKEIDFNQGHKAAEYDPDELYGTGGTRAPGK